MYLDTDWTVARVRAEGPQLTALIERHYRDRDRDAVNFTLPSSWKELEQLVSIGPDRGWQLWKTSRTFRDSCKSIARGASMKTQRRANRSLAARRDAVDFSEIEAVAKCRDIAPGFPLLNAPQTQTDKSAGLWPSQRHDNWRKRLAEWADKRRGSLAYMTNCDMKYVSGRRGEICMIDDDALHTTTAIEHVPELIHTRGITIHVQPNYPEDI